MKFSPALPWPFPTLLALLLFSLPLPAQEPTETPEPFRSLPARLQADPSLLTFVPSTSGEETPKTVEIDLRKSQVSLPEGYSCGAIRVKAPETGKLDLVWAFSVPVAWTNWYILPVQGEGEGFRNFLTADRLYKEVQPVGNSAVRLQALEAGRLKPGQEYFLWFLTQDKSPDPAPLRARIHFAPAKDDVREWAAEDIAKALKLTEAPAARQVAFLKSRGGEALLNTSLFEAGYGEGRIESALTSIRLTSNARGYFTTLVTSIPNCRTNPPLAKIVAIHGEPDLILPGAQRKLLSPSEEEPEAIAFYDYFGFIYDENTPDKPVQRVETYGYNASGVRPDADGLTFANLPSVLLKLRVFYKDRKEVARIANWAQPEAAVLSGELPLGEYIAEDADGLREHLTYRGNGAWEERTLTPDNRLVSSAALENHAYHGTVTYYFEDGSKRAEAPFVKGTINGTVRRWDTPGGTPREVEFKDGEPASPR
jgi:hypothetical protein